MTSIGKKALACPPDAVRAFGRLLGLLAMVSVVSACAVNKDCDPQTDPDCVSRFDAGSPRPDAGTFQTMHYVVIYDQESTDTGGTELDAVALIKGGSTHYADTFHEIVEGSGIQHVSTFQDPNQALGPPGCDGGTCADGGVHTVFLGGTGGSIVVSFGGKREISEGDLVRVLTRDGGPGRFGISVGPEPKASSPHWITCTASASVSPECSVPPLPPVQSN